jgi:hypothetical protein
MDSAIRKLKKKKSWELITAINAIVYDMNPHCYRNIVVSWIKYCNTMIQLWLNELNSILF